MIDGVTSIRAKCSQDLWDLLYREALERDMPLGELATIILARHFKRKDLEKVPRLRPGRPRKAVSRE